MEIIISDNRFYNLKKAVKGAITGFVLDKCTNNSIQMQNRAVMQKRRLGKTNLEVPIFSLGGQGVLEYYYWNKRADKILNHALDLGVSYIDTSPNYGKSQQYIGKYISHRRHEFVLASKTRSRDYDNILRSIEKSLNQLRTDVIDIMQIHCLDTESDFHQLFQGNYPGIKALIRLKDEGVINFIGASSDASPQYLAKALREGVLDTVLIPVNPADVHENSYIKDIIPLAREKKTGVMGMQVFASGRLPELAPDITRVQLLHYALSQDVDTVVVGVENIKHLEENVIACSRFRKPSSESIEEIEKQTEKLFHRINRYKSREVFS
ncbi:oxidoreductase [Candidatus Scalindua japonica]|uniref:Oxidoreductase n=1 Tax=Candidatus Scalindua japonica TaxID=1284222 RepID=A0A286TWV6_9BACT|nr:aldo/keto reductase [Candidatus Scalindua japonica]GAX60360.1 oxidoreductase [Candidatus Scalindua japonica]